MARSRREIAFVKRLARYLAAALSAKLVWNWPERWSEWKEIDRVTTTEEEPFPWFRNIPVEYFGPDGQLAMRIMLPFTGDVTMTVQFNEEE